MGLLNNLILILAIKILFLKVNIWHVNAIPFIDPSLIEFLQLKLKRSDAVETFNDTNCNEPIRYFILVIFSRKLFSIYISCIHF